MARLLSVLLIAVAAVAAAPAIESNPWVRVPGGSIIHRDCIRAVKPGTIIDTLEPCPHRLSPIAQRAAEAMDGPYEQIYTMDVHYTPTNEIMQSMNASFKVPAAPTTYDDQIVYLWPGFKSDAPTMGLPVLQPVLQYGTDCCGGGDYWCVRSWFVYGNEGIAYQSAETRVNPGDYIASEMTYSAAQQLWTINAVVTSSGQNTTLFISADDVLNTEFKVAMLVLETVMDQSECTDLPASGGITFDDVSVNGKVIKWTDRIQIELCGEKITDKSSVVTFGWNTK